MYVILLSLLHREYHDLPETTRQKLLNVWNSDPGIIGTIL